MLPSQKQRQKWSGGVIAENKEMQGYGDPSQTHSRWAEPAAPQEEQSSVVDSIDDSKFIPSIHGDKTHYVTEEEIGACSKLVTIFGGSGATPDHPLYNEAYQLGYKLAQHGYTILNGGYSGTMEATSKGAYDARGKSYGVVVPHLFQERHARGGGNQYLTGAVATRAILERLDVLMHKSPEIIFIALPGQLGTLQELISVWSEARLTARLLCRPPPAIYAWRNPWKKLVSALADGLGMPCDDERLVTFVDDTNDLMRHLMRSSPQPLTLSPFP